MPSAGQTRRARELRVYRLAALLTGNPNAATAVIESVVDLRPDLRTVDSAHLDRLTVLRSRELPAGRIVSPRLPDEIAEALAGLEAQQREAWVFARVYRLPLREVARCMDCSVTALQHHLDVADARMGACSADEGGAADRVLEYALSLEVPAFHRARVARRKRWRMLQVAALVIGIVVAIVVVARMAMG